MIFLYNNNNIILLIQLLYKQIIITQIGKFMMQQKAI